MPPEGDMHVWQVRVVFDAGNLREFRGELSEDERNRSLRFRDSNDAGRFVAAHGVLRRILGRYLGIPPSDVAFGKAPGKPRLADSGNGAGLEWNMSHSGEMVLVVVGSGQAVGADIEQVKPLPELWSIAEGFFHPDEMRLLRTAANSELEFYRIWTRKEALAKASGAGLGEVFRTQKSEFSSQNSVGGFELRDIPTQEGYKAAVAAEGAIGSVFMKTMEIME